MDTTTLTCPQCGAAVTYVPAEQPRPRFCTQCGQALAATEPQPEPAAAQPKPQAEPTALPEVIEFAHGETAGPAANARFATESGELVFSGWLPEGYAGSATIEQNPHNADVPVVLWASARNGQGREWFFRREQSYDIDRLKSDAGAQTRFMSFEEYLDTNAARLLGTTDLTLISRVMPFKETTAQIGQILQQRRQRLESMSNDLMRYIVQGEYGAAGGRIYRAVVDGRPRYLLLEVSMLADEFGTFSPLSQQMAARNEQLAQQLRGMMGGGVLGGLGGGFGGLGALGGLFAGASANPFAAQASASAIDTDPATPFGCHRTDGLMTATIQWVLFGFCGFASDTLPTRDEIRDFYRHVNSLRVDQQLTAQIQQIQEQIVQQKIRTQQQMSQAMQQMARDQQQSFERRNAIMQDLSDHRDRVYQEMRASREAADDRRMRQTHEAIMGVDTYVRTDGSTVEVDVRHDRVFQRENDPELLIGASRGADVPIDWVELHKLV